MPYTEARVPDFAKLMTVVDRGVTVADFETDSFGFRELADEEVAELHFHPGYLDQFVIDHSSMTLPRCRDLDTLCQPELKQWLKAEGIEVITFEDL